MVTTAADIIADARKTLIDTGTQPRWTDEEMLLYISDAQRAIVTASPSVASTRAVISLDQGARQTIPQDGYTLLSVLRNMGVDGLSPGRAVKVITRELLDAYNPTWTAAAASITVQNYTFDPREPEVFYIYPPNTGTGTVEMLYALQPAQLELTTAQLVVQDIYRTAVLYYVLFRAFAKDDDFGSAVQAEKWRGLFEQFVGISRTSDLKEGPNRELGPADLDTRGAAK